MESSLWEVRLLPSGSNPEISSVTVPAYSLECPRPSCFRASSQILAQLPLLLSFFGVLFLGQPNRIRLFLGIVKEAPGFSSSWKSNKKE